MGPSPVRSCGHWWTARWIKGGGGSSRSIAFGLGNLNPEVKEVWRDGQACSMSYTPLSLGIAQAAARLTQRAGEKYLHPEQ